MFAGKTTTLLNELLAEEVCLPGTGRHRSASDANAHATPTQESGRAVLVAKSDRDGRYSTDEVVSHDGLRRVRRAPAPFVSCLPDAPPTNQQPCRAVKVLTSLFSLPEYELAKVVAVDEVRIVL